MLEIYHPESKPLLFLYHLNPASTHGATG